MDREAGMNILSKPRLWWSGVVPRSVPGRSSVTGLGGRVAGLARLLSDQGRRLAYRSRTRNPSSAEVFAATALREAARRCRVSVNKDGSVEVKITLLKPQGQNRDRPAPDRESTGGP